MTGNSRNIQMIQSHHWSSFKHLTENILLKKLKQNSIWHSLWPQIRLYREPGILETYKLYEAQIGTNLNVQWKNSL